MGFKPKLSAGGVLDERGNKRHPTEFMGPHLIVGEIGAQRGHGLPKVIKSTRDVEYPVTDPWKLSVEPTPSLLIN